MIFLIRHGESEANAGLPTSHPGGAGLTPLGYEQAERIAECIKPFSPHLIVTSSYLRAKQTAERSSLVFRNVLSWAVTEEEWPVEEFTYLTPVHWPYSTVRDRRSEVERYWDNADPEYVDGPGAESFEDFIERVRAFLDRLKKTEETDEAIVVFSHNQFINAVLWLIDCKPHEISSRTMREFRRYLDSHDIPNGGMVWLKFSHANNRWSYELITKHLEEPLSVAAD